LPLFIAVMAFIGFVKIYNKPHINVSKSSPEFFVVSKMLLEDFTNNEVQANSKYLDEIVQVEGTISEITEDQMLNSIITLTPENAFGSVICHLSPEEKQKVNTYKKGQKVVIKGICTGYLMDVILVKCVIVDKQENL